MQKDTQRGNIIVKKNQYPDLSMKLLTSLLVTVEGKKTLTIMINNNHQIYNIKEDGTIGHSPEQQEKLLKFLKPIEFGEKCVIIVRQFTEKFSRHELIHGKKTVQHYINLYGFVVLDGEIKSVPVSELQNSYEKNGKLEEPDLLFFEKKLIVINRASLN